MVFILGEERHLGIEHPVVQHRLDVKHLEVLVDDLADPVAGPIHRRAGVVKVGIAAEDGLRRVMRLERRVVAEPDADRLRAAIHRDQVNVDVDQQV